MESIDKISAGILCCVWTLCLEENVRQLVKTKGEQQLGRLRKRIELQGKVEWIAVIQTEEKEPKVGMMTIS